MTIKDFISKFKNGKEVINNLIEYLKDEEKETMKKFGKIEISKTDKYVYYTLGYDESTVKRLGKSNYATLANQDVWEEETIEEFKQNLPEIYKYFLESEVE
jgi:predicted PP-loop superfamily ATPase